MALKKIFLADSRYFRRQREKREKEGETLMYIYIYMWFASETRFYVYLFKQHALPPSPYPNFAATMGGGKAKCLENFRGNPLYPRACEHG